MGLLVLLGIVWGSAFIAIRFVLSDGATPFFFVMARMLLASALMGGFALARRERLPPPRELLISALLGGAFVMGGYQVMLFWGEQYITGGLAGVLVAASPLLTAVLSLALLRHEAFGRTGALGLGVGFLGVALLFEPELLHEQGSSVLGLLSVLGAAFVFALGSVLLRKWRKGGEGYWGAGVEFLAGGAFALPFVLVFEPHPYFPPGPWPILALVYLAGVAGALGFAIYFELHRRVGPGRANLVSFVSPAAAVVFGVSLLGEQYAWVQLGGFAAILVGLLLLQRGRAHAPVGPGPLKSPGANAP